MRSQARRAAPAQARDRSSSSNSVDEPDVALDARSGARARPARPRRRRNPARRIWAAAARASGTSPGRSSGSRAPIPISSRTSSNSIVRPEHAIIDQPADIGERAARIAGRAAPRAAPGARFGTSWNTNEDIAASKAPSANGSSSAKATRVVKRAAVRRRRAAGRPRRRRRPPCRSTRRSRRPRRPASAGSRAIASVPVPVPMSMSAPGAAGDRPVEPIEERGRLRGRGPAPTTARSRRRSGRSVRPDRSPPHRATPGRVAGSALGGSRRRRRCGAPDEARAAERRSRPIATTMRQHQEDRQPDDREPDARRSPATWRNPTRLAPAWSISAPGVPPLGGLL